MNCGPAHKEKVNETVYLHQLSPSMFLDYQDLNSIGPNNSTVEKTLERTVDVSTANTNCVLGFACILFLGHGDPFICQHFAEGFVKVDYIPDTKGFWVSTSQSMQFDFASSRININDLTQGLVT